MYLSYYKFPELQLLDSERAFAYIHSPKCQHFLLWDAHEEDDGMYETLEDGSVKEMQFDKRLYKEQMVERQLSEWWSSNVDNVYYISSTFEQAMLKCFDVFIKMAVKYDVLLEVHEDCCLIWRDSCYFLCSADTDEDGWKHIYLMRTVCGGVMVTYADFYLHPKEGLKQMWLYDEKNDIEGLNTAERLSLLLQVVYMPLIFKKYGHVEIETVSKNKTLKKSMILNQKVNNFMAIDVQVLDSRWFTTICRDEGFMVSGHFRLQPKKDKDGNWTRELIYINPFAKHGYHRQATKLDSQT